MRYDVKLQIDYGYEGGSDHSRILLRLLPGDIEGEQNVLARQLVTAPAPAERSDRTDFFGNVTTALAWHEPISAAAIRLDARVHRMAPPPRLALSPRLGDLAAEIAHWRGIGPLSPHHFGGPSRRAVPDAAIRDFARDQVAPGMATIEAVGAVGAALHGAMRFDADATDVDTPVAESFAARHGVCQDFTHIMIACLRSVGVPAGYVSGFLRTYPPRGKPRLEGADAMHAWVRAWCGAEAGWVEFDPTNNVMAGEDHIVVARGRDYDDVAPVCGALRLSGDQVSSQAVDVIPLDEA